MDLIELLMGLVASYLTLERGGSYPTPELDRVFTDAALDTAREKMPEIDDAAQAYANGTDIDWVALAAATDAYIKRYQKEPRAKASMVKALNAYKSYFKTGSSSALKAIERQSALMRNTALTEFFMPDTIDQDAVVKQVIPLVKKLGGTGQTLTPDQSKVAKIKDPEGYAQYLTLRKQVNASWKAAMSTYVRSTGKTLVPFQDVLSFLESNGIQHTLPTGFTGKTDAVGGWYTDAGEPIAGGAPQSTLFPTVRMNPNPSDESPWVFQAIRNTGEPANYFYTEAFQKSQAAKKFSKVASFNVERTRKNWITRLKGFSATSLPRNSPDEVAALVLEILYQSSNRIGSRIGGNPEGGGFGICTLLVGHFYPQTDGKTVKFIYLGKDSVKTTTVIKSTNPLNKLVCDAVYALAKQPGKTKKSPLFSVTDARGNIKPLQPASVNALFKAACGNPELTVHKLRTAVGTSIFREYVDTLIAKKKNLTERQVLEEMKRAATFVGKELNHVRRSAEGETTVQWTTSIKNYIDPTSVATLFDHYQIPYPLFLEKLIVEANAPTNLVGPDGKELDWNALTREQREAFNDMTDDAYMQYLNKQLDDTEGGLAMNALNQAMRQAIYGD